MTAQELQSGLVIAANLGAARTMKTASSKNAWTHSSSGRTLCACGGSRPNVVTIHFKRLRLLQVADLVVSSSTALVAGNTVYSLVPHITPILRKNARGCVGGVGMKLHPDHCYVNLYHWLWGDAVYVRLGRRTAYLGSGGPTP